MIYLTSFEKSLELKKKIKKYSTARRQPGSFNYETLEFLAPLNKNGKAILLDGIDKDSLDKYASAYKETLKRNWSKVNAWLKSLSADDIALCCWCPYTADSKKYITEEGTFACHTLLIGALIEKYRPDLEVFLDEDRWRLAVMEWKMPLKNHGVKGDI